MIGYKSSNNGVGLLLPSLGAIGTTLILETNQGDLFPSTFPFLMTIEKITGTAPNEVVIQREIVKCTNKSGDNLTIVRSAGTCPPNDTSTTQGTTAFDFDSGDRVSLYITAELIQDIYLGLSELETNKLDKAGGIMTGVLSLAESSNITSADPDLSNATGNIVHITGTTTITDFGIVETGTIMYLIFDGILTLKYNGTSLILPTSTDVITAVGDVAMFKSQGSGNWKCLNYQKINGQALENSTDINGLTENTVLNSDDEFVIYDNINLVNRKIKKSNVFKDNTFTLGENMTALDQVVLQTNGEICKWDGYSNTGTIFSSGTTLTDTKLVYLDTNKIACAYIDTTNNALKIRVGTVVGGTITYGTEVTIDATVNAGNDDMQLVKLDTDSGLVMYLDSTTTDIMGCPFTVSGTTVTAGTPVVINVTGANLLVNFDCCTIDTNKVLFHYGSGAATSDCTVRVGTVATNVLSLGIEDLDWAATDITEVRCCKLDTDKALLTVKDNGLDLVTAVCTVSGTTITVATANKDTYTGTIVRHSVYQVSTNLAVVIFDETDIKSMYISVSSTTPVIRTVYTILASTTIGNLFGKPLVILNNNMYGIVHSTDKIIWFIVNPTNYEMYPLVSIDYGVVIGTAVDFLRNNALPDGKGSFFINDSVLTTNKTYFMNYGSHYLIGILQESGTTGQSKSVAISGEISSGHTSLLIGEKYYSKSDGSYTINPTVFGSTIGQVSMIGKPKSATEMIVNIPYENL